MQLKHLPSVLVLILTVGACVCVSAQGSGDQKVEQENRALRRELQAKDAAIQELKEALDAIMNKNVYLSEYVSGKLVSGLHNDVLNIEEKEVVLNEKEREFLKWTCSELSYKEIADKMFISPRTVDDYRQALFARLKVHSRVGLVMYAIKNKIIEL